MEASSLRLVDTAPAAPEAVVAGHVSLDVYPALDGHVTLEPGRLVEVGPATISTGGAVANTGLALHRLGVPVRLIAKVGADLFGSAVVNSLRQHGEQLAEGIAIAADEATSYTIVINPPGEDRSFLHCRGANQTFSASDIRYEQLAGARVFHFGYPPLMPLMYADGGAELRTMFSCVEDLGVATSLDLCVPDPSSEAGRVDWRTLLEHVLPSVDVFAPSIEELLFVLDRTAWDRLATGAPLASLVDSARLAELASVLTEMGAAVAAIKLGEQGLYLRTTADIARIGAFASRIGLEPAAWCGREVLSPCFEPRAVLGTTGSGDATIAGLLAAMLRGASPADAATSATAVGACSVEAVDPVSGITVWSGLEARIADGWPRLPVAIALDDDAERDALGTLVLRS